MKEDEKMKNEHAPVAKKAVMAGIVIMFLLGCGVAVSLFTVAIGVMGQ